MSSGLAATRTGWSRRPPLPPPLPLAAPPSARPLYGTLWTLWSTRRRRIASSGLRAVLVAADAAAVVATAVEPPPPPPTTTSDADNAPQQQPLKTAGVGAAPAVDEPPAPPTSDADAPEVTALQKRRERARIRAQRRNPPTTEAERLRRERIGAANAGKQAWNKGRRHPEETLERLRDGTRRAMASDEVKAALRAAGERRRGLSRPPETRERIGAGIAARRAAAAEALRERWRDPAFRARQRELAESRREERAAELAATRAAAEAAGLPVPRECLTLSERRALGRRAAAEAQAAERAARAEAEARSAERAARAAAARALVERCSATVDELEQRAAALANDRAAAEHARRSLAQGRATLGAATARLAELEQRRNDHDEEEDRRMARAR